jgi:hypothetical protein
MEVYILVAERLFQKELIKAFTNYDEALKEAGRLALEKNTGKNPLQRYSFSIVTIDVEKK